MSDDVRELLDAPLEAPRPVFVDATGRRRRRLRRAGYAAGALCAAYALMLVVSLTGGAVSPETLLPLPGVPGKPKTERTPQGARGDGQENLLLPPDRPPSEAGPLPGAIPSPSASGVPAASAPPGTRVPVTRTPTSPSGGSAAPPAAGEAPQSPPQTPLAEGGSDPGTGPGTAEAPAQPADGEGTE